MKKRYIINSVFFMNEKKKKKKRKKKETQDMLFFFSLSLSFSPFSLHTHPLKKKEGCIRSFQSHIKTTGLKLYYIIRATSCIFRDLNKKNKTNRNNAFFFYFTYLVMLLFYFEKYTCNLHGYSNNVVCLIK